MSYEKGRTQQNTGDQVFHPGCDGYAEYGALPSCRFQQLDLPPLAQPAQFGCIRASEPQRLRWLELDSFNRKRVLAETHLDQTRSHQSSGGKKPFRPRQ